MPKVYRYRSGSDLAIKELLYGELFFASRNELNDPYDTRVIYKFENPECFLRLFEIVKEKLIHLPKSLSWNWSPLIEYLNALKPNYEKLLEILDDPVFLKMGEQVISSGDGNSSLRGLYFGGFCSVLKEYIKSYVEKFYYVVSFSHVCDSSLMWAHYANQHKGYCLEFTPVKNSLFQNPQKKKGFIKINSGCASSVAEFFEFNDVKYSTMPGSLDGFECFPLSINNLTLSSEDERKRFWDLRKETLLKKYEKWEYEDETRLMLAGSYPWVSGQFGEFSKNDRLFYYDQTQLTGIIFGARMASAESKEIEKIVVNVREDLIKNEKCKLLPPFSFYKAVIHESEYRMRISCIGGLSFCNEKFDASELEKEIQGYKKLKDGYQRGATKSDFLFANLKADDEYFSN